MNEVYLDSQRSISWYDYAMFQTDFEFQESELFDAGFEWSCEEQRNDAFIDFVDQYINEEIDNPKIRIY